MVNLIDEEMIRTNINYQGWGTKKEGVPRGYVAEEMLDMPGATMKPGWG